MSAGADGFCAAELCPKHATAQNAIAQPSRTTHPAAVPPGRRLAARVFIRHPNRAASMRNPRVPSNYTSVNVPEVYSPPATPSIARCRRRRRPNCGNVDQSCRAYRWHESSGSAVACYRLSGAKLASRAVNATSAHATSDARLAVIAASATAHAIAVASRTESAPKKPLAALWRET